MGAEKANYYYHPIPGSRNLVTGPAGARSELEALEAASGDAEIEVDFEGEKLIKGPALETLPAETIARDLEGLDPLGQAVFLHLFLLSVAKGANWCRVGMTELCGRTGMSRRRLLRSLSDLASAGKIKPLHRDKNGTMYKIYSVYYMQKKPPRRQGKRSETETAKGEKPIFREKPVESPVNEEFYPGRQKVVSIRRIAETFFENIGRAPDDIEMDEAVGQVTYLLEDGYTRDEAMRAVKYLAEKYGQSASIAKLPYVVNEALESFENGEM